MNSVYGGRRSWLHPVQAVLLAGMLPLFIGALLSDYAYSQSYQIQWSNFAGWLTVGGLVFCGFSLLWAVIELFWPSRRRWLLAALLLGTFVVGFVSMLLHSRDAYAVMPGGLIGSILAILLAVAAVVAGFAPPRDVPREGVAA